MICLHVHAVNSASNSAKKVYIFLKIFNIHLIGRKLQIKCVHLPSVSKAYSQLSWSKISPTLPSRLDGNRAMDNKLTIPQNKHNRIGYISDDKYMERRMRIEFGLSSSRISKRRIRRQISFVVMIPKVWPYCGANSEVFNNTGLWAVSSDLCNNEAFARLKRSVSHCVDTIVTGTSQFSN